MEELETRVRELEAEQELQELRAIVEAQEATQRSNHEKTTIEISYNIHTQRGNIIFHSKFKQTNVFTFFLAVHLSNKNQSAIKKESVLEAALTEQRRIIESQSRVQSFKDKIRRKPAAIFKIHFADFANN